MKFVISKSLASLGDDDLRKSLKGLEKRLNERPAEKTEAQIREEYLALKRAAEATALR